MIPFQDVILGQIANSDSSSDESETEETNIIIPNANKKSVVSNPKNKSLVEEIKDEPMKDP